MTGNGATEVAPGDLVGSKEAAELLGVSKGTLKRWRDEAYLPGPFQVLAAGPVWLRSSLEAFKRTHDQTADGAGRRPGAGVARD